MKVVKKFTSFEELKSCKTKTTSHTSRLKNHTDFENLIKTIKPVPKKLNQSS